MLLMKRFPSNTKLSVAKIIAMVFVLLGRSAVGNSVAFLHIYADWALRKSVCSHTSPRVSTGLCIGLIILKLFKSIIEELFCSQLCTRWQRDVATAGTKVAGSGQHDAACSPATTSRPPSISRALSTIRYTTGHSSRAASMPPDGATPNSIYILAFSRLRFDFLNRNKLGIDINSRNRRTVKTIKYKT